MTPAIFVDYNGTPIYVNMVTVSVYVMGVWQYSYQEMHSIK